jgi:hypothetical protein
MRAWWQKEDVEALIKREQKLAKEAKKRGDEYDSSWDIKALKEVLDSKTLKDDKARTPTEEERSTNPEGIEFVTGFQKGIGASFYTFVPGEKKIIRTKLNKDPRGKMPIDWLYGDIDGSNPLGRGIVELVGGLQNLIDSDMQMYQFNRALMLAPPLIKRGSFNKNRVVYEPNRIIDVGLDQGATVEPLNVDTSAVVNYPQLYGLQKSQLLNLVNSPDTSISADVGNPGFSKTHAGVEQQRATISVDDNYVRKMFEKWFENWAETAINVYFAEKSGVEELQLDNDTAARLQELIDKGAMPADKLLPGNKIIIDYDNDTPALKFCVDASTSKTKDDQEQLVALQGLLETLQNNPILQNVVGEEEIVGVWNSIVLASGVEDPDELKIDLDEYREKLEMAQEQQVDPEMEAKAQQESIKTEQEAIKLEQDKVKLAQDQTKLESEQLNMVNQQLSPDDQQIIGTLQQLGVADDVIQEALDMLNQGYSGDQVYAALTGGMA